MMNRSLAVGLTCALLAAGCRGGQAPPPQSPPPPQAEVSGVPGGAPAGEAPAVRADREHLRELGQEAAEPTSAQSAADAGATPPATQPAPGEYGAERFRLVNQRDEIVAVLENGLVVIAKRVTSPVAAVRAYALTGGVYEGKWLGGGLSHLLEHLVAGGTNDRRSEAENRNLLQRLGNNSNAYTTTDHTCYFVNTTADRMDPAVDLLAGWMFGAAITEDEYAREYEVVQRELEMGEGEPDSKFFELAQMNRYRVSPARVPVIGYQEVIRGLSRDDVYSYYKLAYQPNNMIFSVAADLDPEVMVAAVRRHVARAPAGRAFDRDLPQEPAVVGPRTVVATFPKLGQAKLQLGFPSITLDHPDLFALDLLSTVLAGGDSSILVEELRDKRQLVSAVGAGSYTPTYADGTFAIQMELDPDKVADATDAVLELLDAVKSEGVTADQLRRAKTQMRVARVKRLQTSEEVAASLAEDFMSTGDPHFSDRYVEGIEAVTNDQLKAVAVRYLDKQRLLTSALLPAEFVGAAGLPKAEDLLRRAAPTTRAAAENPESTVKRVELPDGTILLAKRIGTTPLVVMNMYALGGLTAEDERTNGIGNLTMQMLPRGTATRSAREVAEFFDSIGGDLSTTCGNNSWTWSATCLKADFANAFEVYADVVNNPAFPADELATMKKRVLAQIASQDADWTNQAFRYFKQQYYGPLKSPYQFMPVGTEQNVAGLEAGQLTEWYRQHVLPARRVLAIYGDIDPAEAEALARKHLRREAAEKAPPASAPVAAGAADAARPDPAPAGRPAVSIERVETRKTEQPLAGVVIGFNAGSVIGEDANFPIAVADTMTSGYGYPTGYLHEILRGRGLVYVVHAVNSPGRSAELPGTFMVYAGCDPKNVDEVVGVIVENIARLQGTPADVNAEWFGRSKELAVVSDAMENQTPAEQAATAALNELFGLGYDYHDRFADKIKAVDLPAVREVARRRLSRCVVTVSTPAPELVTVKPGLREFDAFPEVDLTPKGVEHDAAGAK
jgi:zinc protease